MDAAVFKVQQTLGAIAANVRTEIGKWEERNDAASNALSRLEGILERSAAVRAAGIPEATKLGTRSARHAVQPTPTAAAGAGAGSGTGSSTGGVQVDDESKSSKVQVQVQGGWGKLSAIKGLPLALARALAKDTERWAKAVTTEMDALVRQLSLSLSLPHLLFLFLLPSPPYLSRTLYDRTASAHTRKHVLNPSLLLR